MNRYEYCFNRPTQLVDFDGLAPVDPTDIFIIHGDLEQRRKIKDYIRRLYKTPLGKRYLDELRKKSKDCGRKFDIYWSEANRSSNMYTMEVYFNDRIGSNNWIMYGPAIFRGRIGQDFNWLVASMGHEFGHNIRNTFDNTYYNPYGPGEAVDMEHVIMADNPIRIALGIPIRLTYGNTDMPSASQIALVAKTSGAAYITYNMDTVGTAAAILMPLSGPPTLYFILTPNRPWNY